MPLYRLRGPLIALMLATTAVFFHPSRGAVSVEATNRVSQTGTLVVHPQLAQPGDGTASASAARTAISAHFRPARAGRKVLLQLRGEAGWSSVATARQNGRGVAEFTARAQYGGSAAVYRAVAARYDGLAQIATTAAATDRWGEADISEEFSEPALHPSSWRHRLHSYSRASNRTCSRVDERALAIRGGAARLSVAKDPDRLRQRCSLDGKRYAWRINGHIGSSGLKSFRYGYAAARIKFQPRRGQHGAFWLLPQTKQEAEGSATLTGAEIDVVEWFGNDYPGGGLGHYVHYYPSDGEPGVSPTKVGGRIKNASRFGSGWASKYHVFSVEWTPKRYVFRIDGKESMRIAKGVSGQPQYLVLSLLSSDWEIPHMGDDSYLPQTMSVDWVRVWDRDPAGRAADTFVG